MDPYKVIDIPIKDIHPAKGNRDFDGIEVKDLAESIKTVGLINPILVEKNGDGYIIVAGHRRYAACKKLKWDAIPASILENETDTIRVVDNIQRSDIHPMDEAIELENLLEKHGDVASVAAAVGKSKSYVYSRLRLANLCEGARDSYKNGSYSHGVMTELARLTEEQQKKMLNELNHMWNPTQSDVQRKIQDIFFMRLSNAPFDIKNAGIVPEAGSCIDCPKRAKNSDMLFEDLVSTDTCTDHVCWKNKRMKNYNQQLRALKDSGEEFHLLSDEDWNVAIDKIKASKWTECKKKDVDAKKGLMAAGYHKGKIMYFQDLRSAAEQKAQSTEGIKKQREANRTTEDTKSEYTEETRWIDRAVNEELKTFFSELKDKSRIEKEVMLSMITRFQWQAIIDYFEINYELPDGQYFSNEDLLPIYDWLNVNLTPELFKKAILELGVEDYISSSHIHGYGGYTDECELARDMGFDPAEAVIRGTEKGKAAYAEYQKKKEADDAEEKKKQQKEKEQKHNEEMAKGTVLGEPREEINGDE